LLFLSMAFASVFDPDTRLILFNCLGFPFLILTAVLPIWVTVQMVYELIQH
jgi:hypothetical protein